MLKVILGYENRYFIDEHGTIKNKLGKILKPQINMGGYYQICLSKNNHKKYYTIHRLIAQAFIPNPENKPCINHIDGNKLNNNLNNLEWCTYSENNKHAWANGLATLNDWQKSSLSYGRELKRKPVINDKGIIYKSAKHASLELNLNEAAVAKSIGRKGKCAGYFWRYI